MSDYRDELERAITATHGVDAVWLGTERIKETFRGETAWEGDVEIFSIQHPRAIRCYAWGVRRDDDRGWDVTAVLGVPPINSAHDPQ